MKAQVYEGPGKKSWKEVPNPKIVKSTDVIVKMVATTICGTDLHILKGDVATCALQMWAYLAAYKSPHYDPDEQARRTHFNYPLVADRVLGLGEIPSVRLQRLLARTGPDGPEWRTLDRVLVWAHWSWFMVPHGAVGYILIRRPARFVRARTRKTQTAPTVRPEPKVFGYVVERILSGSSDPSGTPRGTPASWRDDSSRHTDMRRRLRLDRRSPDQTTRRGARLARSSCRHSIFCSMSLPFFDRSGSVQAARLKQQGRRFPLFIFEMVTSTRRLRVPGFWVALTQRTHSQRAIGVISLHRSWIV